MQALHDQARKALWTLASVDVIVQLGRGAARRRLKVLALPD